MPSPDQIAAIAALAKLGQSEQQIATTVGLEIGDVETVLAGDSFVNPYVPPSSGAGGRHTIACPFAYNTPNLVTGAVIYTPTIGDILHDAWIEIDTAWNGTTPTGDIGPLPDLAAGNGLFASIDGSLDMTQADVNFYPSVRVGARKLMPSTISLSQLVSAIVASSANHAQRMVPFRWTAATALCVLVSSTGIAGANPGSTQGAAVLYLDISTPSQ